MKRWAFAVLTVGVAAVSMSQADSIWDRRDPRTATLFQDLRAARVGDVLTVIITETTVANEQDQRAMTRGTKSSANLGFGNSGNPGQLYTENSNRQFNGSAQLTTNRVFTDRMTVTVVDVMPNGNLVLEGYRSRVVAGEERVLRITGIARQADVTVGNLIPSEAIANFRISYLGRGPETRFTNQGPLGRLFNRVWPW